tara:strand:+ start:12293 stop:14374 length:2082 start_codon:yes stop_codon:yes gene_type:complete
MAETPNKYSLYQGQKLTSTKVDWGTVASDVTQSLSLIAKDRKDRKQKIKDDTTDALNQLAEVEFGAANSMNGVLLDGSNFSQKTMQNAYDLVSRGVMDISDFQQIKQQQLDGYKSLSNYAKSYSASYESALENVNNGTAAGIEQAMRMSGLKFGNMDNKKLWSDPTTGRLVLVDMVEQTDAEGKGTGEYFIPSFKGNEERFITPNEALNFSRYEQTALNLKEDVTKYVTANLGSVVKDTLSEYSLGLGGKDLESVTDFRQIFDELGPGEKMKNADGTEMNFDQWLTTQAQGVISSETDAAEYLFQAGQIEFIEGTRAKGDTDNSKIYFTGGGQGEPVYEVTEAQMELALNLGKNEINSQLDLEVKKQKGFAGSRKPNDPVGDRAAAAAKEDDEKNLGYLEQINVLLTGDLTAANNEARDLIADFNKDLTGDDLKEKGIRGIVVTKNTIRVVPIKGEQYEVQRFEVGDDDSRTQRAISEDAYGLFNRIVAGRTITKKKLKGYVDANEIQFGDVREDSLSYREKQKAIDNSLINRSPTASLDNKDPYAYIVDVFGGDSTDTSSGQSMEKLEDTTRSVLAAMIPPAIMTLAESSGFANPLTTIVMNDNNSGDGANTITFSFGGEDVVLDFNFAKSPTYMYEKIETAIEEGIKKINVKRRRGDIDTQSTYDEWKIDQVSNPTGDTTLGGYMEWLNSN